MTLSSTSASDSHKDLDPSQYFPLYSHLASPESAWISLLSISVLSGLIAATESCSKPKSTSQACDANSSPIECLKSMGLVLNGLIRLLCIFLCRSCRPSISTSMPNPQYRTFFTVQGPVNHSSCSTLLSCPIRSGALSGSPPELGRLLV